MRPRDAGSGEIVPKTRAKGGGLVKRSLVKSIHVLLHLQLNR